MTVQSLKKIAFLAPRSDLTADEFGRYWREVHGPLVANSPGYGAWRKRYVQNHEIGSGPVGGAFAYSGIAQFWLPGDEPNEDAFARMPIYQERIRLDELNFIDMNATLSLSAAEQIVIPGRAPAKLFVLMRRRPGTSIQGFMDENSDELVKSALEQGDFAARLRGWVINHTLEGSFRFPGGRPAEAAGMDCIHEFWFDGVDDLNAAFTSPGYRRSIAPRLADMAATGGLSSFIARELVYFDGEPTEIAR